MEEDEYGGLFLVSVDDLGVPGLWANTKDLLESQSNLHNLELHNKLGRAVTVDRLALQFVASGDKRLQRLRPFAHSPVVWFRHPYAHLLLVSTLDAGEYRSVIKPALKRAIADLEHDWGGPPAPGPHPQQPTGMGALLGGGGGGGAAPPGVLGAEWLIVYVRSPGVDLADKASKKVYDKLKDDFSPRGRTRVIRIDQPKGYSAAAVAAVAAAGGLHMAGVINTAAAGSWATPRVGVAAAAAIAAPVPGLPPGLMPGGVLGLDDLEGCLRECVRSSFESRQAAYMAEVQRLANERRDPNWSFASLYLVKDSLALLLEGCGLHMEAYKEYVELEAAYQETLDRQQGQQGQGAAELSGQAGNALELYDDKFGASGDGAEVATLTSASWRVMRRSVLKRAAVQEFMFRQYLFASQSRLLLRLGRPVDVAERGLRFIGGVASELGQRERSPTAGVRPLLQEAWTLSACLAVVGAVTASVFGREATSAPSLGALGGGGGGGGAAVGGSPGAMGFWDAPGGPGAESPGTGSFAAATATAPGRPVSRGGRTGHGGTGEAAAAAGGPKSSAEACRTGSQRAPSANSTLLGDDAAEAAAAAAAAATVGQGAAAAADVSAAAAAAAAVAGLHVDWQLWVPFEAEVPSLDPAALCGQSIAPSALAASRPADPEALLRQLTFQAFMLALAHLYSSALSALLRLAQRAAQLVRLPEQTAPADGGGGRSDGGAGQAAAATTAAAAGDEWSGLLAAWRQGMSELPSQYACRAVVGMFVDQEEDRQFEATPQQQATQLQLLRQAISGQSAIGGGATGSVTTTTASALWGSAPSPLANVITPRGDSSPAATSAVWLTPPTATGASLSDQPGHRHNHRRSDSLYSVSIAGGASATGAAPALAAAAAAGGADPWDATPQAAAAAASAAAARSAISAMSASGLGGPGGRTQMSWMMDPELISAGPSPPLLQVGLDARGAEAQRKQQQQQQQQPHHTHSSSDNASSGSFFSKLDVFASKVSSAFEPLKPHRAGAGHQGASPRAAAGEQAAAAAAGSSSFTAVSGGVGARMQHLQQQQQLAPEQPQPGLGGDRGGGGPAAGEAPSSSATALPLVLPPEITWLRDWRVRQALSSPGCCADLALQLALAAASCYSRAGRLRSAAQLYGDVGAVLLGRDQAEVVAELMEHLVSLAQAEGWYALLGRALPVMMAAQQAIGHVMLPYTCVRFLSLPPLACHADVRTRVLAHLLTSAGCCPTRTDGAAAGRARRPPLPSAVLQLSTGQAVQAALLPGWTSKFFGTRCASGMPSLVPPSRGGGDAAAVDEETPTTARDNDDDGRQRRRQQRQRGPGGGGPGGGGGGAAQFVRVGDVCSLEVQVYSNLPVAVPLSDLHLVLGTIQPTQPHPHSGRYNQHNQQQQQQQQGQTQAVSQAAPSPVPPQQPPVAWGRSFSGTSTQPPPGQAPPAQPQPFTRAPASSFSLAQTANTHNRNLSGGDIPVVPGFGAASGSASGSATAWRAQSGGTISSSGATTTTTTTAPPLPQQQPPPASAAATPAAAAGGPQQRSSTTDLIASQPPTVSLDLWAAATPQPPPSQQQPPYYPQPPPLHLHPSLARVSASGMSLMAPPPSSWGSASAASSQQHLLQQQQQQQQPSSPSVAASHGGAGAAAAAAPSRLTVASRGGAGGGIGGGLDRNMSSNTSSSLSLGPAHTGGGGGGGSYSNISEASGLGRRAPSWADTLSAATSFAQAPGATGSALFACAGPSTSTGVGGKGGPFHELPPGGGGGGGGLTSPGSTRGGAGPGWAAGDDLACHHLVEVRHVQAPKHTASCASATANDDSSSPPPAAAAASPDSRTVVLQPGLTRLTFCVAPTRPGLYFARHVSASLGSYDLRIPVVPAAQLTADVRSLAQGWAGLISLGPNAPGTAGGGAPGSGGSFTFGGLGLGGAATGAAAAIAQLGEVADGGEVAHLEVALQVAPLLPRLLARPVLVGGSLAAGLPQWLGVALAPMDMEKKKKKKSTTSGATGVASEPAAAGPRRSNEEDASDGGGEEDDEEGASSGGSGLQYARVHVQARVQSVLRLGEWFPGPPASTPLGPLSAMPSLPSMGGAPPHFVPAMPATEPPGDAAATMAAAALHSSSATAGVGFASPAVAAAAAAALAAAPSFHRHHLQAAGLMSAASTFRRAEASGQCRVAVIDLAAKEAAAAAACGHGAAAGRAPRPSASAEGAMTPSGAARVAAAADVHWTVSSRQGIDLSQALSGPLRSPVLLWLPVWVPPAAPLACPGDDKAPLDVTPELVRVQQAHAGVTSSRYGTAGGGLSGGRMTGRLGAPNPSVIGRDAAAATAAAAVAQQQQPSQRVSGQRPLPPLELEVVVEGLYGGLWRSHATSLAVPLQQPFRVRTKAHQLPDTHVLVSVTVTSCLALPVLVTEVVLEPQYGLVMLGQEPAGAGAGAGGDAAAVCVGSGHLPSLVPGLLPLQLAPNEAVNWGFVLSRSAEALQAPPGLHPDDCCLLHMAFCVVPPPAATAPGSVPSACEVLGPALQPVSDHSYPLPPLLAPGAAASAGEGWSGGGGGLLTPGALFSEFNSGAMTASSPGGASYGHGHGCPPPPYSQLHQHSQQYPQQQQQQAKGASAGGQTPGAAAPASAAGFSCPNVYSHNGAYAMAAMPRSYDGLGGAGVVAAAAAAAACASGAGFSFTHGFLLEFPPSNALTHNLVSVRLLGPHSVVLGQSAHLTWLITRVSSPPAAALGGGATAAAEDDADVAVYEVAEAADAADGAAAAGALFPGSAAAVAAAAGAVGGAAVGSGGGGPWQWRQAVGCRGSIRLGRAKGSVAVVEAVVLPVALGLLRAPVLRLRGLREVREEDAAAVEYVVVVSPAAAPPPLPL